MKKWACEFFKLLKWCADPASTHESETDPDVLSGLRERKVDSLFFLKNGIQSPYQRVYDRLWSVQRQYFEQVIAEFNARDIPLIVFKGAEMVEGYFNSRSIGILCDVDFLVERSAIEETKALLHNLGFRQAEYSQKMQKLTAIDVMDVAEVESQHYELIPFCKLHRPTLKPDEAQIARRYDDPPIFGKGGPVAFIIELDIHHQVAGDIPSEQFFKRAAPSAFPGALTMSPADHLWFMTSRYYNEVAVHGKRALRDLAYLAALMGKAEIDWGRFVQAVKDQSLHASAYYYSAFLNRLLNVVPDEVLREISPIDSPRKRDWGWQLGVLFDWVDPMPDLKS